MKHTLKALLLILLTMVTAPSFALFGQGNSNAAFVPSNNARFVPVDEAFVFSFYQQDNQLLLNWQVKQGYYLYQERLNISGQNVTIDTTHYPNGSPYHDEFFGDVHIYTEPLSVEINLSQYQNGSQVIVQYQGCAEAGFCYPPETRVIDVAPFFNTLNTDNQISDTTKTVAPPNTATTSTPQQDLTTRLKNNWWTPALFLLLGIGLAFTPCVLPMYPILTSIVLGTGKRSQKQALWLSMVYVQGMALTYTLLGLVVASAGMQFQAAMQHPYVLIGLSLLFIALAMSMFGAYTLQLPSSMQTWLNGLSNQQQGGNMAGVFAMGAISGLVCSPCTTAPLSGALLYVAQSGDLITGGVALYALALGMGVPLIAAAVFGNTLLPKAGGWMDKVKVLFGFVLLSAPLFLLERIIPEFWATISWGALGLVAFGWLYHQKNQLPFGSWKQTLVGIIAVLGMVASVQPLYQLWNGSNHQVTTQVSKIEFIRIKNLDELSRVLEQAKQDKKPVMLDFYADWCVACKEFEKYTFHDAQVESVLQQFILVQADVTKNQPEDIELLKAMGVLGLPTIEFWNKEGNPLPNARLTGFVAAPEFLSHLQNSGLM